MIDALRRPKLATHAAEKGIVDVTSRAARSSRGRASAAVAPSVIAIVGASALAAAQIAGGSGLPEETAGTMARVVLRFLLGFEPYSVAFAAVRALVSRQEDLCAAVTPLTLLLVGAYWLSLPAVDFGRDPTGRWTRSSPSSRRSRR